VIELDERLKVNNPALAVIEVSRDVIRESAMGAVIEIEALLEFKSA